MNNYTHVARYFDESGFYHVRPIDEHSINMLEVLDDAKLETLSFEKIDIESILDEFCEWMNKVTLFPLDIEDMDDDDVKNWARYQNVEWYKVIIVSNFLEDCKK